MNRAVSQMYQPVPESLPFNMVLSFVEELPAEDAPDIFGMTDNAEKACREMQASEIIHTLVDVQPRITHVKGRSVSSSFWGFLYVSLCQPSLKVEGMEGGGGGAVLLGGSTLAEE